MTNPITASYTDPLLNSLRATVKTKDDGLPFLLFPVRLETRFMEVEQVVGVNKTGVFENLLGQLGNINILLFEDMLALSINRRIAKCIQITELIKNVNDDIRNAHQLVIQEINWLKQQELITQEKGADVLSHLQVPAAIVARRRLSEQLNNLKNTIAALEKAKDPTYLAVNDFIKKLKKTDTIWTNLSKRKLPYTNPNNKRRLYNYITRQLRETTNYFNLGSKAIEDIKNIRKNQVDKIASLLLKIRLAVTAAPNSLKQVHSDQNWNKYIDDFEETINNELLPSIKTFTKKNIASLRVLEKYKTVSAQEVYFKGVQTLVDIKKFIETEHKGYKSIKKSRKKLDKHIRSLANMANQMISGTPSQVDSIQSLWKQIDPMLNNYQRKISRIDVANNSQKFGVKTTLNFTKTVARKAIAGLNKSDSSKITFFSNQQIKESSDFFIEVTDQIKQLHKRASQLKRRNSKTNRIAFDDSLKTVTSSFTIASRKNNVLPQENFNEILFELQKAKEVIASIDDENTSIRNKLLIEMEQTLTSDFSKIRGKESKPFETLETPPVLSMPTKTVNQLWLRIYPDDIHIHTHEEKLTQNEVRLGKLFWNNYWLASGDKELELGAWGQLKMALGARRAAWVAKTIKPREQRYRNKRPFFNNKPASRIIAITDQLKSIQKLLKPITPKSSYQEIIEKVTLATVTSRLSATLSSVLILRKELKYFLQKSSAPLQRIEGKLYLIQSEIDKLTEAQLQTNQSSLSAIGRIFDSYTKIRSHFSQIKALDNIEFLQEQNVSLTFPRVSIKTEDWTVAPHSRTLPDRFVAITIQRGRYKHIVMGEIIPENLQLGLNPEKFDLDNVFKLDEDKNLIVDEGMLWMSDYQEALKVGMAISIPLSKEEAAEGFDKVLVLGIKDISPTKARKVIEDLLENHHYSADGMSILKTGTPTNNTEDSKSGFNSSDEDNKESFRIEMSQQLFESPGQNFDIKDGQLLTTALGLKNDVFYNIANSDGNQITNAKAINKALWHATMGHSMNEIFDSIFTYDNIERTEEYFTNHIYGRGNLPAIRIGTQPYGILTTTAFSKFRHTLIGDKDELPKLNKAQFNNVTAIENQLQKRFDIRIKRLLDLMNFFWSILRSNKVKHLDNVKNENPQTHFMNMLGLNATSIDYYFRYGVNIAMRGADNSDMEFNANFKEDEEFSPQSMRKAFNQFLEEGYFFNSFDFKDEQKPLSDEKKQKNLRASRIRDQFEKARLFKARFLDKHVLLNGERIGGSILSETKKLDSISENGDTYIDWLLKNNLYKLLGSNQIDNLPSSSLLFLLLRQSLLGSYNYASLQILRKEGIISESESRKIGSSEKYRVFHSKKDHFTYSSTWSYLFKDLNRLEGLDYLEIEGTPLYNHLNLGNREKSMADYLRLTANGNENSLFTSFQNSNSHRLITAKVKEVWKAIDHINTLPTAELNRLLSEHIDLCSYRLDAWILGQSNKRLSEQRSKKPKGIHLGSYGWIENLRPGGERKEVINLPASLTKKGDVVYSDEDNEGFIHAPSINQAIAAAVLRSGYQANSQEEDLENTMAVNLSSARVRMALGLLDGVRSGLEVGAVLGFQFERGLHERYQIAELDKYIQPLRKKFPLSVPIDETTNEQENARETNVVNGMNFLDRINETLDSLEFENDATLYQVLTVSDFLNCPQWLKQIVKNENEGVLNKVELKVIIAEIDRMANAFDALGDLAISESVYQIVQGNHVRAAAMVNALAEGKNPPVPQIVDTPRSGTVVTQKVVMNLKPVDSSVNAQPTGWNTPMTPRALVEPSVNNWLGDILGSPKRIRCIVEYQENNATKSVTVTVHDLQLQPIDFLYLLSSAGQEGSNEINKRVAHFVRSTKNLTVDVQLKLKFTNRSPRWTSNVKSFYEIQPLIKQIKAILDNVLPAAANELNTPAVRPDKNNPGNFDLQELAERVNKILDSLKLLSDSAKVLVDSLTVVADSEDFTFENTQLLQLSTLLQEAAQYGIYNSIPDAAIELNDEIGRDQLRQLTSIQKNVRIRLDKALRKKEAINTDIPIARSIEIYREIVKTIFDKQFVLLPQYKLNNFSEIKNQLQLDVVNQGILRSAQTDFPMDEWLQSISEVREKMFATEMANMLVDTFGNSFADMAPVQFPFIENEDSNDNDHWLGIEFPEEFEPDEDKLSLVLLNSNNLTKGNANTPRIGFIIDEWIEIIPHKMSTTGISFHYDQPDATAPQTLLLAVTPQETGSWEWDDLVHTMLDTLNLAKNRALEPDHLDDTIFSQALPSIMAEVVPGQLRDDLDDGSNRNPLGAQVVLDFADNLVVEE